MQTFHGVVGKVLKLGTERIDGVRKVAGECLGVLVKEGAEGERGRGVWEIPGVREMRALFEE